MRKRLFCTILTAVAIVCGMTSAVCAAALSPEDEEVLVRSVVAEYPDLTYAARVGVISVILNRVEAEDYPRTAAGVISTYRSADGSLRFAERELAGVEEADPRSWRMTRDACAAVLSGADITGGALNFEVMDEIPRPLDLDFDDRGEEEYARALRERCKKYKLVVDGVGFW